MITFKAIIIPGNKRQDGTYPVKIRVTFKGKTRRLPTTLVCTTNDLTRSLKIKNNDILNKADDLIRQMRDATKDLSPFDLESRDVDWVVGKIRAAYAGKNFHLDFFEWADRYLESKQGATKAVYVTALNTFARFLGKREIDINDISRAMLLDFVDYVDNEPRIFYNNHTGEWLNASTEKMEKGASSRHLMKLAHIFNAAKDRYNDEDAGNILIPRSPFATIKKVFLPSDGQKNLGKELMQKIITAQVDTQVERIALDAFIVSFGLMGANMADLYNAAPVNGLWVYNRQKTASRRTDKAEMRVEVPEELKPYIARLQDGDGWWLSVLHHVGHDKDICTKGINRGLKIWAEKNNVPVFTFYAARHTWASLARKAGIEKATIDDALCHKGDFTMADIYAERSWELIWDANRKVLDLFSW